MDKPIPLSIACPITDEWFFLRRGRGFSALLTAQVLVGSWGGTPPIWVCGVHFLLLFSLAGFCTFTCGVLTGILHLHTRTTLFDIWKEESLEMGSGTG